MKNIILVGIVGAVLGGMTLIGYLNEPTEAVNTRTVIEEVHPEWATDADARAAAEAVVLRKAQEAELEALEASFASSTAVYEAERARFLENQERLEKLIGSY